MDGHGAPIRQAALRAAPFYVEGYGIAEVADILGCTEAAARTRLHRGRKKLAAELARLEAAGSAPASTPADPNDPTDPAMQPTTY